MTMDNAWMFAMVGMFGLFLVGIWIEARRSLRALADDDFGVRDLHEIEEDYHTVLARLEARTRLSHMRNTLTQGAADISHDLRHGAGSVAGHGLPAGSRSYSSRSYNSYTVG